MNHRTFTKLSGSLALALLTAACGSDDNSSPDAAMNFDGGGLAEAGADATLVCPTGGMGQLSLAVVVPCHALEGASNLPAVGDAGAPDGGSGDAGAPACSNGTITLTAPSTFVPRARLLAGGLAAPLALALGQPISVPAGPGYILELARVTTHPPAGSSAILGKAFDPQLMPFDGCVRAGEMRTVTVAYSQEPGSEKLWMSLGLGPDNLNLAAFGPAALAASGTPAPGVGKKKGITQPAGVAFDWFGNLWLADTGKVVMHPTATLGTSGEQAPSVVLSGAALPSPRSLAFDDAGSMWVANGSPANNIVAITSSAQASTGMPVAAVTLTSPDLMDPEALALDQAGNLWVASKGNNSVIKFAAARLAANYSGPADVVLTAVQLNGGNPSSVAYNYRSPQSLAFDRAGNLWVGFFLANHMVRFTPADLAASKRIDDPLYKQSGVAALVGSLVFDEQGGLWYPAAKGIFARLSPASLATSGSTMPDRVIEPGGDVIGYVTKLAINPTPAGLPIRD